MVYYLGRNVEFSIDLSQWMIGLNWGDFHGRFFNVFLGPFRLGWYENAKEVYGE